MKNTKKNISIEKLHPFENHPYKVQDNEEMDALAESIKMHGVVSPITRRCGGIVQGVVCHGTPVGALYAGAVHRQQTHRRCRLHRCHRILFRRHNGADELPFDAHLLLHSL